MIHKLVFDATDATTQAASSNVGAYLRASDGTLLTHTDVSGKKALDVNVASGINVEVDLSHTDDSVRLGDGTAFFTSTTNGGDVGLDVNLINTSIAVTATQLDIDDLNATDDAVAAWLNDGSGNAISSTGGAIHISDGGGAITVDGTVAVTQSTSPWVVSATQLDIDDLNATDDAVSSWTKDGTGNAITSTTGALDVNIANTSLAVTFALASSLKTVAETVGVAAAAIIDGADELAGRRKVYMYNNGNKTQYIGATGVTTAAGFPIPPGAILELDAGDAMDIFAIADGAGQNMRTLQVA